jgi:hypothetical protein
MNLEYRNIFRDLSNEGILALKIGTEGGTPAYREERLAGERIL